MSPVSHSSVVLKNDRCLGSVDFSSLVSIDSERKAFSKEFILLQVSLFVCSVTSQTFLLNRAQQHKRENPNDEKHVLYISGR